MSSVIFHVLGGLLLGNCVSLHNVSQSLTVTGNLDLVSVEYYLSFSCHLLLHQPPLVLSSFKARTNGIIRSAQSADALEEICLFAFQCDSGRVISSRC